jgi:hypothetical protein
MLAELELPVGSGTEEGFRAWLKGILDPLQLYTDLLQTITISAQDAAARAHPAEAASRVEHIHIIVYIPQNHASNQETWGFFWVEKFRDAAEGITASAHLVEFYLYMEAE